MPKVAVTKAKPSKKIIAYDVEIDVSLATPRISVREYMRNFKLYNEKVMNGASFIIAKNDVDQVLLSVPPSKKKKKYSMKDLFTLAIPKDVDRDQYISEKIDQIVYGI